MFFRHTLAPLLFFLLCALPAFAQSPKPHHARLSLISENSSLTAGHPEWIGLRFDLDPGWHIYWTNPGDSGEPPKVSWRLPAGFKAGDLQFPVPKRIPDHSLMDFGYEGNVVLLAKITSAGAGLSKPSVIAADVNYLICREVCIPAKDHVLLNFETGKSAEAVAEIKSAKSKMPQKLPPGHSVSARAAADSFILAFRASGRWPKRGTPTDFIPADQQVLENAAKPIMRPILNGEEIVLKKSEQLNHSVSRLRGLLICGERAYNIDVPVSSAKK